MVSRLTTFKFFAAVILAVAVIFGGYFAVSTVKAQAVTLNELVELFISLGIIPADKAAAARAALSTSSTTTTTTTTSCTTTFTRNLSSGATGAEVMALQKFLNGNGFAVAAAGAAGSAGHETSTFGPATKAAVKKFQTMYAADILTPVGLTTSTGYWGASSRAKANTMCSSSTTTTTTGGTTTTTTGGTLVVGSTTQPSQTLAPGGASHVPFTKFTLTNTSSAPVTVSGVTVQLTGLGVNAVFSGVSLIDSNNVQYGIAKTLNSNHQAVIGDTFTINAGETKTFTVAGNMTDATTMQSYAGQVIGLSVIAINTTATISGSLPINGAMNITNATLIIGSVSTSTSAYDPGVAQTKNIGDAAVRFSGVRFTASSVEDVSLYSIRFRQAGTASAADITNVMVYVDGTSYPTTVDSTGKYYTAVFPSGLLIQKGFSKDVYVQGDITGSGAAGRNADFDIDKASDVYFVGQTFGYGIAVSGSWTPWFNGYITTINAGTATSISKANEVAAANVAVNVQNQVLGGFATEFKGESVSVQSMKFTYSTTTAAVGLITNISLVNENGVVVAGPTDATWTGSTASSPVVTFSDTVTFPTGRHVYTIKGKIPAGAVNNATVIFATTPNSSNWTTAVGQTSGNTITLPNVAVAMNTMTVKAGASTVSISSSPANQSVVSGVTGFNVSNVQFDGTQSGEDVRYSAISLAWTNTSLNNSGIVNCFAYDGTTRLNDTAVSPALAATGVFTFSFNTFLVVPKGTVKTVAIKCDVPASVTTGSFAWGVATQPGTSSNTFSGTGVSSGSTVYPIATGVTGPTMTIAGTGTLTVVADSSTPTYRVVAAGTTGVTLGVLKFHATNEAINLSRVALQMSNTSASSSPSDLSQVTLWDGTTQVGTALFTGTSRNATSTLTTTVQIPANSDKIITIKGDMAWIGTSLAGTEGALVQVDYDGNDSTGTQGIGTSSGTAINAWTGATVASNDTAFAGVRNFRSYPTVAQGTVGSTALTVGSGVTLDRFTVTANSAGSINLDKVTINVATSTVSTGSGTTTVLNLKVYAYTDSGYSNPVGGSFTNGQVATTLATVASGNNAAPFSGVLTIPAGVTYYFAVKGDVAQVAGTNNSAGTVTTKLVGDSAYPSLANTILMGQVTTAGIAASNFVWSPNATTTTITTDNDWTNGYLISGLPTDFLNGTTLVK